ncbi:type VII secretion protein EccB [Streptomyces sp. NPDC006654]|uniref:type VII secretion protein EccB n=1 Tax=Streptomyces sp. NPDC006654 TaxID=3156897 RepID=UPI00340D013C
MQNRRDQVQAYRFVVARLNSGLLRGDPDAAEPPARRTDRGIVLGGVLAVVLGAGSLVWGVINPGGATGWRDGQSLVVEKDTGARYLYDGDALRPIRNYASARLLIGAGLKTQAVSPESLRGTAHGDPIGIDGAPDDLPDAGSLGSTAWEVCGGSEITDSGAKKSLTTLVVDSRLQGASLTDGVLVQDEHSALYLVWHANRYRLSAGRSAATALGYGATEPLPVSAAFLDAVPAGADLAAPAVTGQGEPGPDLDGTPTRTGQVFVVRTPGSDQQYYLLLRSGLTPLTTTQAALALGSAATREKAYAGKAPTALPLSSDMLNRHTAPRSDDEAAAVQRAGAALPSVPPAVTTMPGDEDLCLNVTPHGDEGTGVELVTVSAAAVAEGATAPGRALAAPCLAVDAVSVPVGGGSLVRALGATGSELGDTTYLVTDTGQKYRVTSAADAAALGYTLDQAQKLPSPLLDMLPTGPDLSAAAARAGRGEASGTVKCSGRP